MEGLARGRIVAFVLPNGAFRPAIIVRVWVQEPPYTVQLQVFTDSSNDGPEFAAGVVWRTSVTYSKEPKPYTWHWPADESESQRTSRD